MTAVAARARRITLHAAAPTPDEDVARASVALPDALEARERVAAGDEVAVGGVSFLVGATEPAGAVRVDLAAEVTILPRPIPTGTGVSFAVVGLLDASWSMRRDSGLESRFEAGRLAVRDFLQSSRGFVNTAAVATFRKSVAVDVPFTPPRGALAKAVEGAPLRGRSDLASGLDGALSLFVADPEAVPPRRAILLATDGSGSDPDALKATAARAARLGVQVHVLDLNPSPSADLEAFARATGGTFQTLSTGRSFGLAFDALAAEVNAPDRWAPATREDAPR